ncbi:MAG: response regulator [Deltaproteobacteria bacterium]|nr:response regulator [Deltaproteobacteria bacterium]
MIGSIKSKFYVISILLIISFSVGYGILAYFLHRQNISAVHTRDIILLERDFKKLNDLFQEIRFWEKVLLSQKNPKADMKFGSLIEEIRGLLSILNKQELSTIAKSTLKYVIEDINRYETKFNELIQLKIKQSLLGTRMETTYSSMASIILNSKNPSLLKPLFNLTHFMRAYHASKDVPNHQALKLVIGSVSNKLSSLGVKDIRMEGYLHSINRLLDESYEMELNIVSTNKSVEDINTKLQNYFNKLTLESETLWRMDYQETIDIRQELQTIFLLSAIVGVLLLLIILYIFSKSIITPIRSVASVMKEVKAGDMGARFKSKAGSNDEIIQFGLSFNEMLDTLQANNQELIRYQKELEQNIIEISERKIESQRLTSQLQRAEKMESIGTLAGGIAHDFNNILSSVIGYTQLSLDDAEKGSALEDNLQEVYTAGIRAKDLVKQILSFARQSDEKITPIKVGTIVKEVVKFIRSSIPTTIEIKSNIKSGSLIMGNATQVHQILMNLCTNAAHAMEDEGGVLEISLNDVTIDNNAKKENIELKYGSYIELVVSDTGVGIAAESIDSIFEPYFTTKGAGEGTGLGLAMVHGIVESYGGNISVNSTIGEGTVFTIYLPITKRDKSHRPYETEEFSSGTERILFVDDEAPIAKMGGRLFERLGYKVTTRSNSIEALDLFRSKPNDFDLVISDMTMPNMTGDQLAAELMIIRPDIPVILCTGYSKKISAETAAEIGIKAFVDKPIEKTDVAKTIRKVLEEVKTSD